MPNWKKVIVSGSNVSQLNNDGVYLRTIGDGILSSSAQIASEISGAFTATSASLSNRIDNITGTFASTGSNSFKGDQTFSGSLLPETTEVFGLGSADYIWAELYVDGQSIYMRDTATNTFVTMSANNGVLTFNNTRISAPLGFLGGILSSSAQIASEISGAFTATSGGFSTRVTSLENAVNNTTFSASIQERVTYNEIDITALQVTSSQAVHSIQEGSQPFSISYNRYDGTNQGSALLTDTKAVVYNFTSSANTRLGNLEAATSSYALKTAITGAFAAPSSSFSTRVTSLEGGSGANIYNSDGVVSANRTVLATDKTLLFQMSGSSQFLISDGPIVGTGQTWTMQVDSGGVYLDGLLPNTTTSHIVGYDSVSTQLSYFPTSSINLTLDNVTDNGSTTTNGITIGGLTVNGDATITGTLTAQRFNTELVSSSIIYESGSTKFGDTSDDIHSFTGSVKLNTQTAATTDTDKFLVFDTGGQIKYRTGTQVLSDINPGGLISSSAQLTTEFDTRYLNTTGDGVISSSAQVTISSTTGYTTFSSSIASDIAALNGAGYVDAGTGASGSRIAFWTDTNTIRGYENIKVHNNASNEVGLFLGSNSATNIGRRVLHGSGGGTGTISIVNCGLASKSIGAHVSYTVHVSSNRNTGFRAGTILAVWDSSGGNIQYYETSTSTYGTLPNHQIYPLLIGSEVFIVLDNSSGTSLYVTANADIMSI